MGVSKTFVVGSNPTAPVKSRHLFFTNYIALNNLFLGYTMEEKEIQKKLDEIIREMSGGNIKYKYPVFPKDKKGEVEVETSLPDCINTVRLCVKYLLFDLEASKRENDYLRSLLKNK